MLFLGLLLAGLGIAAIADFGGSDDSDSDDGGNTPDEVTTSDIITDGEPGVMYEGTAGDDEIYATTGSDLAAGEDGNDVIRGRAGPDVLMGGEGDDSLFGQTGQDRVMGDSGDDEVHGGAGEDTMMGGSGNDTLYGGPGDDELVGADITNRDWELGDWHAEITPSSGHEFQAPEADEANVLYGGDGNDSLLLGEGDTAFGGSGNDEFEVGSWVEDEENVPVVQDFNAAEDILCVQYLEGTEEPSITLGSDGEETLVYADGQLVLRVLGETGTLEASDVCVASISFS
jgi:Ca2+-binding RTX toxin-like protein